MEIHIDEGKSVVYVAPGSALTMENFIQLSNQIDPYLKQHGMLKGLVIETQYFPGWNNVSGMIAHIKFMIHHQAKIQKIALVTNSKLAEIGRILIGPFVKPQIKHFPYDQLANAKQWIEQ